MAAAKGLLSVWVRIEIEKQLKRPISHYFEWISDANTGSIITAMLSLNTPLRNIKVIYYMPKDKNHDRSASVRRHTTRVFATGHSAGEELTMGQIEKKILITGSCIFFRTYPRENKILNLRRDYVQRLVGRKKDKTAFTQ